MNCPYCNKEMTLGYIQSRDGVYWSPKHHAVSALNWARNDCISLVNKREYPGTVYAYRCDDCRKVIIEENRK